MGTSPTPSSPAQALALLGLGDAARRVYAVLLARPSTSVERLLAAVDDDPADVHAALELLLVHGLVTRTGHEEGRYVGVDPAVSLRTAADRLTAGVRDLRQSIPHFVELFESSSPAAAEASTSRVVTDLREVGSWYVQLRHEVTSELLIFDRPPHVSSPVEQVETSSIREGVLWRGIYARASLERPGAMAEVQRLAAEGERARVLPDLPVKMVIADRRAAMVSLSLEPDRVDTLVTHDSPLVGVLVDVFLAAWERAAPLGSGVATEPGGAPAESRDGGPSPEDRAILALVAAGMTDESVARQLGLSVRSLRRRTHRLMAEHSVDNRFQLGLLCARRGWL
ncbi:hypothetical protein [Pseudokineococcus sp. 1T1Z-3]|uniref:hypothetical protein n=1 Tax=Pseudokineococcus sp. 1T1Z-3 TaxID=3132745 RepID=UPI0030B4C254